MMRNQKILRPCPFCGGSASYGAEGKHHLVSCSHCLAQSDYCSSMEQAIKEWNTRQPAINWQPIEELTEEEINGGENILFHNSNNQYVIAKVFNYKSTFKLITSGNWSCKFNELPEAFTHFAKLTPPEVK